MGGEQDPHADLRPSLKGEAVSSWRLVTWPSCFSTVLSLISNSMLKQCTTVFQMSLLNNIYLSFLVYPNPGHCTN